MAQDNRVNKLLSANDQLQQEIDQLRRELAQANVKIDELEMLFNATPIMFWYKDKENRNIRINRAAAALEGLPPAAIEGKSAYDLYPKEQAEAFHKDDLEVINSGKPKMGIIEKHTSPKTGEVMWLQTGKVPSQDKDGTIIGAIAFAIDITEQKKAEEALQEAHKKLEQQHQHMSRAQVFFSSTVEQMIETVERGAPTTEILEYLKNAREQFSRLD